VKVLNRKGIAHQTARTIVAGEPGSFGPVGAVPVGAVVAPGVVPAEVSGRVEPDLPAIVRAAEFFAPHPRIRRALDLLVETGRTLRCSGRDGHCAHSRHTAHLTTKISRFHAF